MIMKKKSIHYLSVVLAVVFFTIHTPLCRALPISNGSSSAFCIIAEAGEIYYPKCNSKYTSIVDALKSIGVDSSYNNRKKIAQVNGIYNYSGTGTQNKMLLNLLKQGRLVKSRTATSESTLKLTKVTKPGTLKQGSGFTCRGIISSNYKIIGVSVAIRDAKGNVVTRYDIHPNSYTFDINKIDKYIHFSYAKAGTNYYKIWAQDEKKGLVLLNHAFKIDGKTNSKSNDQNSVRQRLDQIMNGSLSINRNTVMKLGCKFTGTRANEECKGYAKNVFFLLFRIIPGSTQSKPNNYKLNGTSGMRQVSSNGNINANVAKKLFSNARPGDFVQIRRRHTGSHSAIVYSVSSSGVTFIEANIYNNNKIYKRTYTWTDLSNKNIGMSVYTASSYKLR